MVSTAAAKRSDMLRKLWRYTTIYGPGRVAFKAAGRLRLGLPVLTPRPKTQDIGLIGCGQFGFATIGYFIRRAHGARIAACFDIDEDAARSLAMALRVPDICASADELLSTPGLRTVYIASNHASHADYAVRALDRGLDVYVEKPVAVDDVQFARLVNAARRSRGRLFAGYNRPFSAAVRWLRDFAAQELPGPVTLQCLVSGHVLGPDHWYRHPAEGTRVCGNIGHWLDLFVHVLSWRSLPDTLRISLTWADEADPDENLNISMASEHGDLCAITLTARGEPFEGIREVIHFQQGSTLAEIEDFRRMTVWAGPRRQTRRFWPKDVGHGRAILQPYSTAPARDWREVERSTALMLHITSMVRRREPRSHFSFVAAQAALEARIAAAI